MLSKKNKQEHFVGDVLEGGEEIVKRSLEKGKNGDPMGMLNIGLSYINGRNGYPKDVEKGRRILQTVIDIAPDSSAAGLAQLALQGKI